MGNVHEYPMLKSCVFVEPSIHPNLLFAQSHSSIALPDFLSKIITLVTGGICLLSINVCRYGQPAEKTDVVVLGRTVTKTPVRVQSFHKLRIYQFRINKSS